MKAGKALGSWMDYCRSEDFGSKNVTRALSGEGIICIKYMV